MTPPRWFSKAMIEHFGCDPSINIGFPLTLLFDHMRTEGDIFITEPYIDVSTAISLAMQVAKTIGCKWHLEVEGEWHPKTVRVEFHPKSAVRVRLPIRRQGCLPDRFQIYEPASWRTLREPVHLARFARYTHQVCPGASHTAAAIDRALRAPADQR